MSLLYCAAPCGSQLILKDSVKGEWLCINCGKKVEGVQLEPEPAPLECDLKNCTDEPKFYLDEPQGFFSFCTVEHLIEYYQELMS